MRFFKVILLLISTLFSNTSYSLVTLSDSEVKQRYIQLSKFAQNGNNSDKYALFDFVDTNQKLLSKHLKGSFELLVSAATAGHVKSQLRIGVIYTSGILVEQNLPVALTWFIPAAEDGNPEAQLLCGLNYATRYMDASPRELNELYKQSDIWLTKAIKSGSKKAKVFKSHLALLHFDSPPFPALAMLQEVAEEGDRQAQFFLGDWHHNQWKQTGDKTHKDKAKIWLNRSAQQGYDSAIDALNSQ